MQDQLDKAAQSRSNCEDICLIAKFLEGSQSAFEELFRKHQGRLFSLCMRVLGNRTDAEDAVQDAFLDIYRGLRRFRGSSSFSTWAYSITVRRCMMCRRKSRNLCELVQEQIEARVDGGAPEDRIAVREAMERLPEHYRMMLILKYYEQLSTEEIAQAFGCSPEQMKSRLHRARNALKDILRQTMGGEVQ